MALKEGCCFFGGMGVVIIPAPVKEGKDGLWGYVNMKVKRLHPIFTVLSTCYGCAQPAFFFFLFFWCFFFGDYLKLSGLFSILCLYKMFL